MHRIYRGQWLTLRAIADASGMSRDTIERCAHGSLGMDITRSVLAAIERRAQRSRRRRIAEASGISMAAVRMRAHRRRRTAR